MSTRYIGISRNEYGLDAVASQLSRDGLIDPIDRIGFDQPIDRKAARLELAQQFRNKPIKVTIPLDDSMNSMTKRDERGEIHRDRALRPRRTADQSEQP